MLDRAAAFDFMEFVRPLAISHIGNDLFRGNSTVQGHFRECLLAGKNRGTLQIWLCHQNDGFIPCRVTDYCLYCGQTRKRTSRFSPVPRQSSHTFRHPSGGAWRGWEHPWFWCFLRAGPCFRPWMPFCIPAQIVVCQWVEYEIVKCLGSLKQKTSSMKTERLYIRY